MKPLNVSLYSYTNIKSSFPSCAWSLFKVQNVGLSYLSIFLKFTNKIQTFFFFFFYNVNDLNMQLYAIMWFLLTPFLKTLCSKPMVQYSVSTEHSFFAVGLYCYNVIANRNSTYLIFIEIEISSLSQIV